MVNQRSLHTLLNQRLGQARVWLTCSVGQPKFASHGPILGHLEVAFVTFVLSLLAGSGVGDFGNFCDFCDFGVLSVGRIGVV